MKILHGESLSIPPSTMYGASTRGVDRYTPSVEKIILAEKRYGAISMEISESFGKTKDSKRSKAMSIFQIKKSGVERIDKLFCDFRFFSPENWAHIFFYHIPIACKLIEIYGEDLLFILPKLNNRKIFDIFELFCINYIESDCTFFGEQINLDVGNFEVATLKRREWIEARLPLVYSALDQVSDAPTSDKIFVNRRGTRRIANPIVREFLIDEGFEEVFPEDYDAIGQLKIFDRANLIVGVHGAGLAPLLLNRSKIYEKKMIGIMPAVQVTSGFRLLCYQSGIFWTGVRGRIDSRSANYLVSKAPPPLQMSYQDFEVCIESLKMALADSKSQNPC